MFVTFKCNRSMSIEELKEVLSLMENQETTDRYINTNLNIKGNDADIDVKIDEEGNIFLI